MTDIVVKRDANEVAREAANRFAELAADAVDDRGKFVVALSGGSTPKTLYGLLANPEFRDRIDWSKVVFFFGDERNAPPDAEESNYRMARVSLFDQLSADVLNVHRWMTETGTPDEVAKAYQSEIVAEFGDDPIFDLVLLGLGPDAHTASLFPGSPAVRENNRLAVENWVEKLNSFRLTMTFPVINAARNVFFLVAGDDKCDALREVIEGGGDGDKYPARLVNPLTGKLTWIVDENAAAGLSSYLP